MTILDTPRLDQWRVQGQARCLWLNGGLVPYRTAWQWQQALARDRRIHPDYPDVLLLLEHPPVYTLGRGADPGFVRFVPGPDLPEVVRVERGGEVTYHAPGQLVGYPIVNLRRHRPDLHWYLRSLEAVVIRAIAEFGITGERIAGLTGVWVDGRKVAAIGIQVSRWVAMHGFAVNVCPDLSGFGRIVPCGIGDRPVGSLADFQPQLTVADLRPAIARAFGEVFGLHLSRPWTIHALE